MMDADRDPGRDRGHDCHRGHSIMTTMEGVLAIVPAILVVITQGVGRSWPALRAAPQAPSLISWPQPRRAPALRPGARPAPIHEPRRPLPCETREAGGGHYGNAKRLNFRKAFAKAFAK